MTPELKAQWVAALRSGVYRQGRRRLRSDAGYCCLGVLCALVPGAWTEVPLMDTRVMYVFTPERWEASLSVTLGKLAKELGLDGKHEDELVGRNDMGEPFDKIADWIDAHV